jgi:hypothetical protein
MKHSWHRYELTNAVQFAELIVGAPVSELREIEERLKNKDFRESTIAWQDKIDILKAILTLRFIRKIKGAP